MPSAILNKDELERIKAQSQPLLPPSGRNAVAWIDEAGKLQVREAERVEQIPASEA